MAPVTPPSWLQAGSYNAQNDRLSAAGMMIPLATAGPLAALPGVKPSYQEAGLRVTQRATPDMQVTVAAGTCFIAATSTLGGVYQCHNNAAYDVPITAAHASLGRRDLIVARVYDAVDDVGTENDFKIEKVTGIPASAPTRPSTPAQAIALAEVLVPGASTAVVTANITDLRTYTVSIGGVQPIVNLSEVPLQPYNGQKIWWNLWQTESTFDGTAWQEIRYGAWLTYTPQWKSSGTQPSLGNGTATGKYWKAGRYCTFHAHIQPGSATTYGSGGYSISLPFPPRVGNPSQVLAVRFFDTSTGQAYMGQATASDLHPTLTFQGTSNLDTADFNSPFTFASGDSLQMSGTYETS